MLKLIFTLDYEIHGNGEGSPYELMVEPTSRLLNLFDEYGAKLTIMADIGEILRFKEHAERQPKDDFHYAEIVAQLQDAVRRGHDVQLHIHSSYFKAKLEGGRWIQDWSEYNFAGLSLDRMSSMVRQGKEFLESILRPVNPDYRCVAFRAANWSVSPGTNVAKALMDNGIQIDTSVFKYGRRSGLVTFDYSDAHSEIIPWPANEGNLCEKDEESRLWEFPIYCEGRWIGAFLSFNRIYRVAHGFRHRIAKPPSDGAGEPSAKTRKRGMFGKLSGLMKRHAWKADFNQCTGRQLIKALNRAESKTADLTGDAPFVLIGHSKIFSRWNEQSLKPFLEYVAGHPGRYGFGVFDGFIHKSCDGKAPNLAAPTYLQGVTATGSVRLAGCKQGAIASSESSEHVQPIAPSHRNVRYVIITPAHNEENLISQTIESVVNQRVKPAQWIIVDDRSTDRTREIAERYAAIHKFISVLSMPKSEGRTFGRKALAFNTAVKQLAGAEYDFIGNIDADMTLPPDYFERILEEFSADSELGLSGGAVFTVHEGRQVAQDNSMNSVGGALQLFRKECFDAIGGGYLPLEFGGIDTAAEIFSRMKGWKVRKAPGVMAHEGRLTGTADRGALRGRFRLGQRFHSLGYGAGFHFCRCLYRLADHPSVIGSLFEFAGYLCAVVSRRPVVLSEEAVRFWRNERWKALSEALVRRLSFFANRDRPSKTCLSANIE